jgi:hypothetical protein
MKAVWVVILLVAGLLGAAGACRADDVSLGLYAHDTPMMGKRVHEKGEEAIATVGSEGIKALAFIGKPSVYLTSGVNLQGKTGFVSAGMRWKVELGKRLYVKVGLGMSVNNGPLKPEPGRIWEGSNANFEPEANIGWKVNRTVAVEASYMHMSQAALFSNRNPGMNEIGLRAVVKFDGGAVWRRIRGAT